MNFRGDTIAAKIGAVRDEVNGSRREPRRNGRDPGARPSKRHLRRGGNSSASAPRLPKVPSSMDVGPSDARKVSPVRDHV